MWMLSKITAVMPFLNSEHLQLILENMISKYYNLHVMMKWVTILILIFVTSKHFLPNIQVVLQDVYSITQQYRQVLVSSRTQFVGSEFWIFGGFIVRIWQMNLGLERFDVQFFQIQAWFQPISCQTDSKFRLVGGV